MLDDLVEDAKQISLDKRNQALDSYERQRYERATRMLDMQSVISNKLAQGQASVNNAENYPSTWTTNPDGGANGQV